MWDQFVTVVGVVGTILLIVFFGYLKWKKHQAIKVVRKNKQNTL